MKNIFHLLSFKKLKEKLIFTIKRFPISVIIILIIATIFFILLNFEDNYSQIWEKLLIINLSLILTFIFSIAIYLSAENTKFNYIQKNLFQFISIWFWIIFYNVFSLDPNDIKNIIFFILSLIWIIAYLFFAPYLHFLFSKQSKNNLSNSIFYNYFYKISIILLSSFIFGIILFILGSIAITAIDNLFNLDLRDKYTYWNWAIISLSLVSPLFFLSEIPKRQDFLNNNFLTNKFFSFLIKYVAIPFIYIYFFILYAYSIKVLSNLEAWPRGIISWLIIWFSIFWYLSYIFSYPFEKESKAIVIFRKIFPYAVIPQIFLLFYAIFLRISQYDFTINRYFVVVFGIWLLIISLYFIYSKKKNLIIIPSSLALFIIVISIIPKYNVYTYPELRQTQRLIKDIKKAWILENWKIIFPKSYSDIDIELSKNIYSEIEYLCNFSNCEPIKKIFPKLYQEIYEKSKKDWENKIKIELKRLEKNKDKKECDYSKKDYFYYDNCYDTKQIEKLKKEKFKGPSKWEIISYITEKLKVKKYTYSPIENKYITFWINYKIDIFPIKIEWYKKMYKIKSQWDFKNWTYAEYNPEKEKILLKENNKIITEISTKEISQKLIKKFWTENNEKLKKEDLTFILENWKYKLYFESITILNPEFKEKDNNSYYYYYTNGYLLIK